MHAIAKRLLIVSTTALMWLPFVATAKVIVVDKTGATVAELKPGPYQIQLPVGKYKAKCAAPNAAREQDFLSLSQPVTVDIDCK